MNHLPSILSFLSYFALGLVSFLLLMQLVRVSRRLRIFALCRRWFGRRSPAVFIEIYADRGHAPAAGKQA